MKSEDWAFLESLTEHDPRHEAILRELCLQQRATEKGCLIDYLTRLWANQPQGNSAAQEGLLEAIQQMDAPERLDSFLTSTRNRIRHLVGTVRAMPDQSESIEALPSASSIIRNLARAVYVEELSDLLLAARASGALNGEDDSLSLLDPLWLQVLGRLGTVRSLSSEAKNGAAGSIGRGSSEEHGRLTPQLRDWARQQFTEEEIVAGLRELRETGGLEIHDFLEDLEKAVPQP